MIRGGQDVSRGLDVVDWTTHGMRFDGRHLGRRRTPPSIIVVHWTGGEGDERQVFRTLINRVDTTASVHFFIRADGRIFQYADLDEVTWHAHSTSHISIGIEMQNKGYAPASSAQPREAYSDVLHGSSARMLGMTPAQLRSLKSLIFRLSDEFGIPVQVPTDSQGRLLRRLMTEDERRRFRGVIGHYHVTESGKRDPGTQPLLYIQENAGVSDRLVAQASTPVGRAILLTAMLAAGFGVAYLTTKRSKRR